MGNGAGGVIFFTVDGPGRRNPCSAEVVDAIRWENRPGVATVILPYDPISSQFEMMEYGGVMMVLLFDAEHGIKNRWSPREASAAEIPDWVRRTMPAASGHCVAVGRRCVASPSVTLGSAHQIAHMFLRLYRKNGGQSESTSVRRKPAQRRMVRQPETRDWWGLVPY